MSLSKQQLETRITELKDSLREVDLIIVLLNQVHSRMYPTSRQASSTQERPGRSQFDSAWDRVHVLRTKYEQKVEKYSAELVRVEFNLPKLPPIKETQ